MSAWYRAYGETLNDPKVQRLPDDAYRAWHNALYLACNLNSKDGNIGTLDDVSFAFRETKKAVSSAFHTLIDAGLIVTVGETFQIVSWKKRQYKSDTSTARVQKYRKNLKRYETVTETPPDTDTDTDKKIPTESKKRATRLPDDWQPDIGYAVCNGLTQSEAILEATKFQNHFLAAPGQKGVKKDWNATWRNWVLNSPNFNRSQPNSKYRAMRRSSGWGEAAMEIIENEDRNREVGEPADVIAALPATKRG